MTLTDKLTTLIAMRCLHRESFSFCRGKHLLDFKKTHGVTCSSCGNDEQIDCATVTFSESPRGMVPIMV